MGLLVSGAHESRLAAVDDHILIRSEGSDRPGYRFRHEILRSVYDALAEDGVFVAYQVRDRVKGLGREVFGPARVQTEMLNVPPMRVYRWMKGRGATR